MKTLVCIQECIQTPIGELLVVCDEQGFLRAVDWLDYQQRMHTLLHRQNKMCVFQLEESQAKTPASIALQAYFSGDASLLSSVPFILGGTEFQREVWQALCTIAAGETRSYAQLAQMIQRPKAIRAVGAANGANPISVLIPCHRVIGSQKALVGYAGGLTRKQWLLEHEQQWQAFSH